MSCTLKDKDILSRFIYKSKEISWDHNRPSSSLFSGKHPNGYSVFETTNLEEKEITQIEEIDVRNNQNPPYGRCDLEVHYYKNSGLEIIKKEPPMRHYNIFGMPISNDLFDADNLSLRQKMVSASKLKIYRRKLS